MQACSQSVFKQYFQLVKIRDVKKVQDDIENDPIIRDQMANLGCILVFKQWEMQ